MQNFEEHRCFHLTRTAIVSEADIAPRAPALCLVLRFPRSILPAFHGLLLWDRVLLLHRTASFVCIQLGIINSLSFSCPMSDTQQQFNAC